MGGKPFNRDAHHHKHGATMFAASLYQFSCIDAG